MTLLNPINCPTCPHCGSKISARGGYIKAKKQTVWKCRNAECGKPFFLNSFVLKRSSP